MDESKTLEDTLRELEEAAARCDENETVLRESRDARDALVLEAIRLGGSERRIAESARLSGPRIHQIKTPLMYAVQILDAGLRDYRGEPGPARERLYATAAISPEEAVRDAEAQWLAEFGEPVPGDADLRFSNVTQPR